MKKLVALGCTVLLFIACQEGDKRYTQNSPEIDTVKQLIANYNSKTYDTSIFADSSKTHYNTKDNAMSAAEAMEFHKANDANYSSRGFLEKDQEYEMVVTDDGETWVNCWLDWQGTLAANGKVFDMPVHLTYQFVDGKIVREVGYWDASALALEMQSLAMAENTEDME
ncbi:MAG: nuclear transport factor 2 family protein [Croceitalea sp.]|nr:nuclear transport factor 2 family protein [Croceitalea sp.]